MSEIIGIHQSDVIIRTALIAAFRDMKQNPWVLDYAFASLKMDDLTKGTYGAKEIQKAKDWFLKTNIDVRMDEQLDGAKFPCVTIRLTESSEIEPESTLGDVHAFPEESTTAKPEPNVVGPFTPKKYDPLTGTMELDTGAAKNVFPDMVVVDAKGKAHVIEDVLDVSTIKLADGTVADFRKAVIRGASPSQVVSVESAPFRETYMLCCHAQSEAVHLTYLYSVTAFALLRYRQAYLEARGFERSKINASDFSRNADFDPQMTYHRFITITGVVRNSWPKALAPAIQGVNVKLVISEQETVEPQYDADDSLIIGTDDAE